MSMDFVVVKHLKCKPLHSHTSSSSVKGEARCNREKVHSVSGELAVKLGLKYSLVFRERLICNYRILLERTSRPFKVNL